MRERHVLIVAFEGLQPLDAVGPHEVFAGAGRAAAAAGRADRYRISVVSTARRAGAVRERPRAEHRRAPRPGPAHRHPHIGRRERRQRGGGRRPAGGLDPRRRPALPAGGHRMLWHLHCRRRRPAGRPPGHHALGPGRRAVRRLPLPHGGGRPHLHPRREVLVERRRHGRHRPVAGPRRRRPRRRRGADGGALARHVPAPARGPDPVRLARLGAAGRALDRARRAAPGGGRARRRPSRCPTWPPRRP